MATPPKASRTRLSPTRTESCMRLGPDLAHQEVQPSQLRALLPPLRLDRPSEVPWVLALPRKDPNGKRFPTSRRSDGMGSGFAPKGPKWQGTRQRFVPASKQKEAHLKSAQVCEHLRKVLNIGPLVTSIQNNGRNRFPITATHSFFVGSMKAGRARISNHPMENPK